MSVSRSDARKLSMDAAKMGATTLGGLLVKNGDRFFINKTDVTQHLENLLQQNVVLVIGTVHDDVKERLRTCLTCGRDYTGSECPRCANVRSRLRGSSRR